MNHLAIILDGNRRWARENGLTAFEGHERGFENLKTIGTACLDRGIEFLTVYAFSTKNWNRSEKEVNHLMSIFHRAMTKEISYFQQENVRLKVIGRREGLPERLVKAIDQAEATTKDNQRGQLNLCINYGGRAEIVDGIKRMLAQGIDPKDVTEALVASNLWTADLPDPDLIIRTSGEQRLSGFLTWSSVYSELFFVEKCWPAFNEDDLDVALVEFERRERRFGG